MDRKKPWVLYLRTTSEECRLITHAAILDRATSRNSWCRQVLLERALKVLEDKDPSGRIRKGYTLGYVSKPDTEGENRDGERVDESVGETFGQ